MGKYNVRGVRRGLAERAGAAQQERRMRLLIAEDDAETAAFLATELRGLGHDVVCAATGDAALATGLESAFDLILLDRMLPGLDGLAVLQRLRAAHVRTPV
ncbi:response regulator, partial [Staphylococcus borealis]|uniref:response regulator n=1 Tax=Staphylococcus borealis TaxID=2742203 RepID=UPI0039EA552B